MKILETYFEKDLENKMEYSTGPVKRFTGNVRKIKNIKGEELIQGEFYIQKDKINKTIENGPHWGW